MLTDFRILLVMGGVAGALVVGTAVVVSQRAEDRFRRERADLHARWETDRAAYELQLSQAHQSVLKLPEPESAVSASASASVAGVEEEAAQLLQRLEAHPNANPETGRRHLRRVVHDLESLVDLGPEVIPRVMAFLDRHEDRVLDFTWQWRWRRDDLMGGMPDFEIHHRLMSGMAGFHASEPGKTWDLARVVENDWPPTLRLGLLEVLATLGGEVGEQAMLDVLGTTQRPAEVAFLARALEELWPGKHRERLLQVARGLLLHPPVAHGEDVQFLVGSTFLYPVLLHLADQEFARTAVNLVVRSNGQVDTWALEFVERQWGVKGVAAMVDVGRDPRLQRATDRMDLLQGLLPWAVESPEVTELFLQQLKQSPEDLDEDLRGQWQSWIIQQVAKPSGVPFPNRERPSPESPSEMRLRVLDLVREEWLDPRAAAKLDETRRRLERRPATRGFGPNEMWDPRPEVVEVPGFAP